MFFVRLGLALVLGGVLTGETWAQSTFDQYGSARADALGQATTAAPAESGPNANPAASATGMARTVRFYARENFGLSALRYGAMSLTVPVSWGTVLGGASTVGFEDYREVHFSAGYARSFSFGTARRIHMGVTLRYYHTQVTGFGSASAVGVNPGLIVQVLPALHLGAHVINVNRASLSEREPLPQTFAVGLQYDAPGPVRVMADVFKDIAFRASTRGGVEVRPVDALAVRVGISTAPTRFTWGAGLRVGPVAADIAAEQHQELGWSPSASLQVHW